MPVKWPPATAGLSKLRFPVTRNSRIKLKHRKGAMSTSPSAAARNRGSLFYAILVLASCIPAQLQAQSAIAFINGRWFNGRTFESRALYSVAGVLQQNRPAALDTTVDLQGGYVIPPFAEA